MLASQIPVLGSVLGGRTLLGAECQVRSWGLRVQRGQRGTHTNMGPSGHTCEEEHPRQSCGWLHFILLKQFFKPNVYANKPPPPWPQHVPECHPIATGGWTFCLEMHYSGITHGRLGRPSSAPSLPQTSQRGSPPSPQLCCLPHHPADRRPQQPATP